MVLLVATWLLLLPSILWAAPMVADSLISDELIDNIERDLFKNRGPCLVAIVDQVSLDNELSRAMVLFDSAGSNLTQFENLVEKEARCLIAVATCNLQLKVMQRLEYFKADSVILLLCDQIHDNNTFETLHKTVLIGKTSESDFKVIYINCGAKRVRIGPRKRESKPWLMLRGETLTTLNTVAECCEHPLRKTNVQIGYSEYHPFVEKGQGGEVFGLEIQLANLLVKGFESKAEYHNDGFYTESFADESLKYGTDENLKNGTRDFGAGFVIVDSLFTSLHDYTSFYSTEDTSMVAKAPSFSYSSDNIIQVFPNTLWILFFATMFAFSTLFCITFHIYQRLQDQDKSRLLRTRSQKSWLDFWLIPFTRFTEPEPIIWFKGASAGKLLATLWMIFSMMMILFYSSNLRKVLISRNYEKPLESLRDVLDSGRDIYIMEDMAVYLRSEKKVVPKDSILFEFISRVESNRDNTYNGLLGIPDTMVDKVFNENAVLLTSKTSLLHDLTQRKAFARPKIQVIRDNTFSRPTALTLRKNIAWKRELDRKISQIRDMGIWTKFLMDPIQLHDLLTWKEASKLTKYEDDLIPFELHHLFFMFIFLGTMMGFAALVFLTEALSDIIIRRRF